MLGDHGRDLSCSLYFWAPKSVLTLDRGFAQTLCDSFGPTQAAYYFSSISSPVDALEQYSLLVTAECVTFVDEPCRGSCA